MSIVYVGFVDKIQIELLLDFRLSVCSWKSCCLYLDASEEVKFDY